MQRFDRYDIVMELIELYRDIKDEILQQLSYYRASVYKAETAKIIDSKIGQLKMIAELLDEAETVDLFRDYEATKTNGNLKIEQGECLLTFRVMNLLIQLDTNFENLRISLQNHDNNRHEPVEFTKHFQKNRRKILAICKHGTRQWSFFKAI